MYYNFLSKTFQYSLFIQEAILDTSSKEFIIVQISISGFKISSATFKVKSLVQIC